MSKSLKKEMRAEFARIIPDVLPAVMATPVSKETIANDDVVFKKFNFRMALATLVIVFFVALAGGGGAAYSNPNTYLTITFSPETINNMLQNLSTNEDISFSNEDGVDYTLTLGVNSFDCVIDIDADNEELKQSIDELNVKNKNLGIALSSIMNYAQKEGIVDLSKGGRNVCMNILTNYESRSERIEQYMSEYLVDRGAPQEAVFVNPGMNVPFFQAPGDVIRSMPGYNPFDPIYHNSYEETYGRVAVINQIMDVNNSYTQEALQNASNRELAHILMDVKKDYNKRIPHN